MSVFRLVICFCLLASFSLLAQAARPDLVNQVTARTLAEANASWWGFNAEDSTDYLQAAIDSGVPTLIIDKMPSPWIVRPLFLASNQTVILAEGVIVEAKRGEFLGIRDALFSVEEQSNVTITARGTGALLRMHIADYHAAPYQRAEWRHGINLRSVNNVTISNLTIADSGGDGIYLGTKTRGKYNTDVTIKNVICTNNNRQGISVINAINLLIEDCTLQDTAGTSPRAGIDFEPNSQSEPIQNCVLRNVVARNNVGGGFIVSLHQHRAQTPPVSVRFENCRSIDDHTNGFNIIAQNSPGQSVRGKVEINNCTVENSGGPALVISGNAAHSGLQVVVNNSRFENCATKATAPIIFRSKGDSPKEPLGGLLVNNLVLLEKNQRFPIAIQEQTPNPLGLANVSGEITINHNDQQATVKIDEQWLRTNFPAPVFRKVAWLAPLPAKLAPAAGATPESLAALAPLPQVRSRLNAQYLFHGQAGQPLAFGLHLAIVGRSRVPELNCVLVSPSGKKLDLGPLSPSADQAFTVDKAPETGIYKLDFPDLKRNVVYLVSSNRPVSLVAPESGLNLFCNRDPFKIFVPAGTAAFALRFWGESSEGAKITVLDPQGEVAWLQDDVFTSTQFDATDAQAKAGGVWTIKFERPTAGVLEDMHMLVFGAPALISPTAEHALTVKP